MQLGLYCVFVSFLMVFKQRYEHEYIRHKYSIEYITKFEKQQGYICRWQTHEDSKKNTRQLKCTRNSQI